MASAKVMRPVKLQVKLLKFGLNHDPTVLRAIHRLMKLVWHLQKVPQQWAKCRNKSCTKIRAGPSAGILPASHSYHTRVISLRKSPPDAASTARLGGAAKEAVRVPPTRLDDGYDDAVRRLQELGRKVCIPLHCPRVLSSAESLQIC